MKRNEFLKGLGLVGAGSFLPFSGLKAAPTPEEKATASCTLIPSETEGPYPLDTVSNSALLRQDIRDGKAGVPFKVRMRILGKDNCLPMQNVWVKIWHCDKDGYYSGYSNSGYLGTQDNTGATFCRGVQITDAHGEVEFLTIFPGWYTSRVTHIHFRVYVSSVLTATSQFTFPVAEKNAIYASNALYSTHGTDPQSLASDNVFTDGYALQMATLTTNSDIGGYESFIEVTIAGTGTGTLGLAKLEPETMGQFKLMQNYPNPFQLTTDIPFTLTNTSDVEVELYDLSGKKVASFASKNLQPGEHATQVNLQALGLASGTYIYQIVVTNSNGVFRQCKVMTGIK